MKGYLSAMKKILRTISIFLLISMMMSFAACATIHETEVVPEYNSKLNEIDFSGEDFILKQNNNYNSIGDSYLGYVTNTEFADIAKARIEEVEKKYNVKIEIITDQSLIQSIQNETYSGSVSFDAAQTVSNALSSVVRAGFMYDLADLTEYLDYTNAEKWGHIESLKPFCWDGGIFAVMPASWPMLKYYSMDGPMIFNGEIISYLNETDPREFAERDEWTWDKFEELMPIYAHKNDKGEDVTSLYTGPHPLFRTIQTTNGEGFIIKDDNGEFQLGHHSERTFEAINTAWNWIFGDYASFINATAPTWNATLQTFIDGKTTFVIVKGTELIGTTSSIAYNMSNYGLIPFPRGPHGSNKVNCGTTITETFFGTGIPQLCEDPTMSAIILNAIYEPLPGYETDDDITKYLRQNFFFDDRDTKTFIEAYQNLYYNYRNESINDVYISINNSKTMREWLDQYAEADENNRQKYVVNIETSVEELFK